MWIDVANVSILVGCELISSENTYTFVWLFSAWLDCMSGKAPKEIITDQAREMQNAIEIAFPQARHRWCLWHVMKKLPEKFGAYDRYLDITFDMKVVEYDSQTPDEFEHMWYWMLVECGLENNKWMNDLFEDRSRWVPCYLKNIFWVGMSTTQRSERINAFFDSYINARTTLKQFLEQYDFALGKKAEKEKLADAVSSRKTIPIVTTYPMEKQIQKRKLPDKYILGWWRKDVIRAHTKIKVGFNCWSNDVETKRYHDLCTKFGELADWVIGDETQYHDTNNWLDCKKKEVQLTIIKAKDSQKLKAKQVVENEDEMVDEDDDPTITDPLRRKIKKGRPRKIANQPPKRCTEKKDGWNDDIDASQTQANLQPIEQQQHGLIYPRRQQQHELMYPG
ncbi:protein FAR-RED IMPAIRED RESPONSE 1-like [Papaver somniferum]|uniref:protein FAR-RED IMPAIRED RESPONSE 1-like n=1 Tax=Papaver somniferum TaxID=3469 RepID=UPI000E6FB695|nr:protein FAR-RED IMPAIRED RESPONSE 1-like [Papaver somniferum]